jgi:16S rRNA (guanine966-N2)-methyltransferase
MRIVKGAWAGRDLVSPGARIRPTAEDVRDRWLGLLAESLEVASVLDLFAGSGALGLEALSRGAARVDFVENGSASLHSLKANVAALGARKSARIFKRDAIPFVETLPEGAYDIAFADPPYGSKKLDRVVSRWQQVPFATILGVEHQRQHRLEGKAKRYDFPGETRITVFVSTQRRSG